MKIGCHCGADLVDQTDGLPNKGYLIPDQDWFATWDAIDDEIIDPLAEGRLTKQIAYRQSRQIMGQSARCIWQCRACGRLYIDDPQGQLQCYLPENEQTGREVLRGKEERR